MRRLIGLLVIGVLCSEWLIMPREGRCQLAVIDAGAILQLALSVKEQIELVAQGVRNLAPWIDGQQVAQEVAKLIVLGTKLTQVAEALSGRRAGWLELTNEEHWPTTVIELDAWIFRARAWAIAGAEEASIALQILDDAVEFVKTALSLLSHLVGIPGAVGGLQSVTAALTTLQGLFAGLQGIIAPFHQAMLGQMMIRDVAAQVWRKIIIPAQMQDWGQLE